MARQDISRNGEFAPGLEAPHRKGANGLKAIELVQARGKIKQRLERVKAIAAFCLDAMDGDSFDQTLRKQNLLFHRLLNG